MGPPSYSHLVCGAVTTPPDGALQMFKQDPAYAADKFPQSPNYKKGTLCAKCGGHHPREVNGVKQFAWEGSSEPFPS